MKKIMKKIVFKICLLCMVMAWLMAECNIDLVGIISSHKKDDISRAISGVVGEGMVYKYREVSDERIVYEYLIQDNKDAELINKLVEAVNEVLEERSKKGKNSIIEVDLVKEDDGRIGAMGMVAFFSNEYGSDNNTKVTSYLSKMVIYGDRDFEKPEESCYMEISTYTSLKGIKSLSIDKTVAKKAREEGIDWYEIWPELEYYEEF